MTTYLQGITSLLVWLMVLLLFYGLPFVFSHVLVWTAAVRWRSIRVLVGPGPAMSALVFMVASSLAVRASLPLGHLIKGRVYPLPWYYHVSSSAGALVMITFLGALQLVLAALSFHLAHTVPRSFFSFPEPAPPGGEKSFTVSSHLVYGAVCAVVLSLVVATVALVAAGLPPHVSAAAVVFSVFVLCLLGWSFILGAPLTWVRGLVLAAALLALGMVSLSMARSVSIGAAYLGSVTEAVRRYVLEGSLVYSLAQVVPLGLVCLVYLWRLWLGRLRLRTQRWTLPVAGLGAALATVLVLYSERLRLLVDGNEARNVQLTGVLLVLVMAPVVTAAWQIVTSGQPMGQVQPVEVAKGQAKTSQGLLPYRAWVISVAVAILLLAHPLWRRFSFVLLWLLFFLAVSVVYLAARYASSTLANRIFTSSNRQSMLRPFSHGEGRLLTSLWAGVIITALSLVAYVVRWLV